MTYRRPRRNRRKAGGLVRRLFDWLRGAALFFAVALGAAWFAAGAREELSGRGIAVDGDSLLIGETRIRLEGIDAPELLQDCTRNGTEYPCGRHALNHLRSLIGRDAIQCEGWQEDKYGRFLGTCAAGERALNQKMVADGWAVSFGAYHGEEQAARRAERGLWAGEFEAPQDWRRVHQTDRLAEMPSTPTGDGAFGRITAGAASIWSRVLDWLTGTGKG